MWRSLVVDVFEVLLARNAWEKRKLGELAKVRTGRAFKSSSFSPNGKYYVVTNKDIGGPQISTHMDGDRIDITNPVDIAKYSLSGRNLLVTMDGVNIGKTAMYSNEDAVLAQRVGRLTSSSLDFVHQITSQKNFLTRMNELSVGNAIKHISLKQISDYAVNVPQQTSERQLIGQTLSLLDNLIAATQRRIDALEQAKKALLQRLFDQSWRFKGYSDPWEKRKLGEVATITMGQSPDSKNYTLNPQDHILVQGNADIKNGWVEPRVWTTQITKIAKKGSVLLSVRAPVGEVSKTAFDVVLGRGVASVGQTDFLYQYLITLKINGFWLRYSTGSTFDSINSADIKDAIIFLPEKNEQSRIAKTLNCIDNLIAATQSRLSSLELLKKSLLQDLFI